MITMVAHKVDAGQIQLSLTRRTPGDVEDVGLVWVGDVLHLSELRRHFRTIRFRQLLVLKQKSDTSIKNNEHNCGKQLTFWICILESLIFCTNHSFTRPTLATLFLLCAWRALNGGIIPSLSITSNIPFTSSWCRESKAELDVKNRSTRGYNRGFDGPYFFRWLTT